MAKRRTTEDTISKIVKVITPILGGLADDLEKENERLREWQTALLELTGTSRPDHVLSVVQTTANRLAEREADLLELCEAAGVSHKGNLLQKLRAEAKTGVSTAKMDLNGVPPNWMTQPNSNYNEQYKKLRLLLPVARQAAAKANEEELASLKDYFQASCSPEDFEDYCKEFIYGDHVDTARKEFQLEFMSWITGEFEERVEGIVLPPFFDPAAHQERIEQQAARVSQRLSEVPTYDSDPYLFELVNGALTDPEPGPPTVWETLRARLTQAVVDGETELYADLTNTEPALTRD